MTATNHALTGALIGLGIANPAVAVPLAFASHFALDAIPHFGVSDRSVIGKDKFAALLICEAAACLTVVILLGMTRPLHWLVAAVCAFVAASPDFMWIPAFLRARHHQKLKRNRHILLFHHVIQWYQRPFGIVVELAWLVSFGYLFYTRL